MSSNAELGDQRWQFEVVTFIKPDVIYNPTPFQGILQSFSWWQDA